MSPEAVCSKCGKVELFHPDELKGVRAGEVFCVDCSLLREYDVFLGEILDGKHRELIEMLKERMKEDDE